MAPIRDRDFRAGLDLLGAIGDTERALLDLMRPTKHLQRLYEKLGVENRTAAAMRAVRN